MIASGERHHGSQLHMYKSGDLYSWEYLTILLDVQAGSKLSSNSDLCFGKNFECASFFHLGEKDYLILGVEEDVDSERHGARYTLWLSGNLVLRNGKPQFEISGHGLVDHGISYAPHIFLDSESRLVQLGWADEAAKQHVVKDQGWAGCLVHPRELFEISRPIIDVAKGNDAWSVDQACGRMTTLGIRPAVQVFALRTEQSFSSLESFNAIRSTNYEVEAKFSSLSGNEILNFNVRESPNSEEVTKVVFDIGTSRITVDRSQSSIETLGTNNSDSGHFQLLPGEDLKVRLFVDESIVEVYANDRFALTSRIYPSLETSVGASYDFGGFDEANVKFACWEGLKNAWPGRKADESVLANSYTLPGFKDENETTSTGGLFRQDIIFA
jgi:beta-fructofuranosidase